MMPHEAYFNVSFVHHVGVSCDDEIRWREACLTTFLLKESQIKSEMNISSRKTAK